MNSSDDDAGKLRMVIFVLASAIFAGAASMRILDSLLPEIARHYSKTIGASGVVVTAYAISYSSFQLFYGPLGDRVGLYRVIIFAAFLSGLAAIGCALSSSFEWFVALRFLAGGVAAAIGPLTLAWIAKATSAEERPIVIANVTGASIIGATAGQAGGGLIGAFLNWQASFWVIGGLFLLAAIAMVRNLVRYPALCNIGHQSRTEEHHKRPGFLDLLKRPSVRFVLIAVGVEGVAMYASFIYVTAFLETRLALGIAVNGALIALFGVGGLMFVFLARFFMRSLSESRRAIWGGIMVAIGFGCLMLSHSIWSAGLSLFVMGVGFFMLHNILQVLATHMAPDATGTGVSMFSATFFLGQALGVAAGGWLFNHAGASISFAISSLMFVGLGFVVGSRSRIK